MTHVSHGRSMAALSAICGGRERGHECMPNMNLQTYQQNSLAVIARRPISHRPQVLLYAPVLLACGQEMQAGKRPHQTPKVVSAHRADDDLATTNSQAVYAGHSSPTQPMAQPAAGILESNNPISLQLVLSSVAQGTSLKLVLDPALPLIRARYSSTQSDLVAAALGSLTCHMLFTNMAAYASFDEFLVVLAPARITHLVPTDLPFAVTPAAHEIVRGLI